MDLEDRNAHIVPSQNPSSAPSVPANVLGTSGNLLFKWLGSFWSEVYEDAGLVEGLQEARAGRLAQLYLDVSEAMRLVDRENAPVFHRERWYPIRVRKSDRDRGSAGVLRFGSNEVGFGEQSSDLYPEGTVFTFGTKDAKFRDFVVYPVGDDVRGGATCIVDSIASPKVFLRPGMDFMLSGGSLLLRRDMDPFGDGSPFAVFDDPYSDAGEEDRVESVLWACDAEVERDYVYGHLGYAVGLPPPGDGSSELYKRVVNAVWNTLSEGASPRALQALVAALCGLPSVLSEGEVVESVDGDAGSGWTVVTSRNVYRLPAGTEPADGVRQGAVLGRFDLLDKSVRVYPYVTDPDRMSSLPSVYGMESDVPSIDIPPALIRSGVEEGFHVGWSEEPVTFEGMDANGNARFRFRLEGSDFDNDVFWRDVWSSCERAGTPMESLLGDAISGTYSDSNGRFSADGLSPGDVCGSVSPIKFFLMQLVGANTMIVTVRTDAIPLDSPLFDHRFFGALRDCVPSFVRLYFIEHCSASTDGYGLSGDDGVSESVSEDVWDDVSDEAGLDSASGFRCRDRIRARFVARCVERDEFDDYA